MVRKNNRSLQALLFVASLGLFVGSAQAAEKFVFDTAHSVVGFSVKHLGLSNTKGVFNDFSGEMMLDEKDITKSTINAVIKIASVDTKNQKRDDHLRAADFFDAAKFPEMTFKSKSIAKKGDGYVMKGMLTIKGVSKEIELPFKLSGPITDPWGMKRVAAEASPITINRQDYGISFNKMMDKGGLIVGNDVTIDISVELTAAPEAKADAKKK